MQAQEKKPDWMRWHYLSEAEMYDTSRGMNFVETDPPTGTPRFVAEFEPMQGVMIRYPLGIPTSLVAQLANKFPKRRCQHEQCDLRQRSDRLLLGA